MTDRSVEHATFAIERTYDASPEQGTGSLLDALGADLQREPANR